MQGINVAAIGAVPENRVLDNFIEHQVYFYKYNC